VKQIELGRNARSVAHFKEKAHRQKRRFASGEIKSGRQDLNLRLLGSTMALCQRAGDWGQVGPSEKGRVAEEG
jgi:hypothetical protein